VADAVSNTSPLLYLYRIQAIHLLPALFEKVWTPGAVLEELRIGSERGHDVPKLSAYDWLLVVDPVSVPSEWLASDLGPGELAALALALENPGKVVLLDDALARRVAEAAGLTVWGTLRVLLEAKSSGLIERVAPSVDRLSQAGMRISPAIRQRVLALAGEPG
jgi:predicted nucleic acid-binding protein